MRKLLFLILALSVVLSLTACGNNGGKPDTEASKTSGGDITSTSETTAKKPSESEKEWYYGGFTATIKTRIANAYDDYTVPSDINVWCDGVNIEQYKVAHIPDPEVGDLVESAYLAPNEDGVFYCGYVRGSYISGVDRENNDPLKKYFIRDAANYAGFYLEDKSVENDKRSYEVYGTDTVAGRSCTIYRKKLESNGKLIIDMRYWIDNELGCVLKLYNLAGVDGDHITYEVTDFILGKATLPGKAGQNDH